jgi:multidrug resistance efflux pump
MSRVLQGMNVQKLPQGVRPVGSAGAIARCRMVSSSGLSLNKSSFMAAPFSRSMRSLASDSSRRSQGGLLVGAVLLGAWLFWFLEARVTVYEVAEIARVEAGSLAHRVDAPVTGRIVATHLDLGREIQAGEVLMELAARDLALDLAEKRTRVVGLGSEIESLKRQLVAAQSTFRAHGSVLSAQIGEARAHFSEASEWARLAQQEAERNERLFQAGLVSEADVARARTQEKARRAVEIASEQTLNRVAAEGRAKKNDLDTDVARLQEELAQLEGEQRSEQATIEKIDYDLNLRKVRAPVAGRIGEMTVLQVGSVLQQGSPICTVIPRGEVRLVAMFPEATAAGRVRPGQRARLRLAGFPSEQYGTLKATVASIASEGPDGRLRVELEIQQDPGSPIPLQHGLIGTVEVEVERVSPAVLVLRAAGNLVRDRTGVTGKEPLS